MKEALKRELIYAGQRCINIATEGRGKSGVTIYKTESEEYAKAAEYRDKILREILNDDPTGIRAPSSKSRFAEWTKHSIPHKEAALQREVRDFELREDVGSVGWELSKSSLKKRQKDMAKMRESVGL